MNNKKLLLFDIDGTLVKATNKGVESWKMRLHKTFSEVFGTRNEVEINTHDFNGMVDKKMLRGVAQKYDISQKEVDKQFEEVKKIFHRHLKSAVDNKHIEYFPIAEAMTLVQKIAKLSHIHYGVLTGNIEPNAWVKLKSAGVEKHFSFGAFGDSVDERADLVKLAIDTARTHFKTHFPSEEIIVIGDTTHDISAGKAHGTKTIGVSTGITNTREQLKNAGADIAVESLMDETVLRFLE